ncbi:hypothetical protein BN14_06912 [Rhizoctonia solani AG-1 IB]|uniref:Uncharacterized protein n=1 Tax=Thanatephorus cucumeris (strain AG1-IB / isolate 7/3/14) TaxID=1108050 RepID=M5C0C2_THACB|nr:hypothetical protein BN14_06912 [Rhizoctonia solani AG-1 IB]
MSNEWISHLPDLEWSLIEGKWRPSLDSVDHGSVPVLNLVRNVIDGNIKTALESDLARQLLTLNHTSSLFTPDGTFNGRLDSYFPLKFDVHDDTTAELVRLAVAVACLHAFLQVNWTGPDLDITTVDILTLPSPPLAPLTNEILSAQAIVELATGGEPAYHLAKLPELDHGGISEPI